MTLKTITALQFYNTLKRLTESDISRIDLRKVPADFESVEDFEKYVSKTIASVKSDFNATFKAYTLEVQQAKINDMLAPWVEHFGGDMAKAYAAVNAQLSSALVAMENNKDVEPEHVDNQTHESADKGENGIDTEFKKFDEAVEYH